MRLTQIKRIACATALGLAMTSCLLSSPAQEAAKAANERQRIMVIVERPHASVIRINSDDLQDHQDANKAQTMIADSIFDWLSSELGNRYAVVDRSVLNQMLSEAEIAMSFDLTGESLNRLRLSGADLIVAIRPKEISLHTQRILFYGKATTKVTFAARVVDAKTGDIVLTGEFSGEQKKEGLRLDPSLDILLDLKGDAYKLLAEAGKKAVAAFAERLIAARPLRAEVLAVDSPGSFILSIGSRDGIAPNSYLQLFVVRAIYNREGVVVHRDEVLLGTVKVETVNESSCKVTVVGDEPLRLSENAELVCRPCAPPKPPKPPKRR